MKRIGLVLLFGGICLTLTAQYRPATRTFIFNCWTNTLTDDHHWQKKFLTGRLNVDLSHTDTVLFSMKGSQHCFTKTSTGSFADEPATIGSFHLLGVYRNQADLPGVFILFYIDETKGVLRKYFFSPHHLAYCDYTAYTQNNPFRLMKWPQSINETIYLRDTIKLH